jgi:hypothetical protein
MYLQKVTSKMFGCHLEGHWRRKKDPETHSDPNPLVRAKDPRIRIRTIRSRIRNTGLKVLNLDFGCTLCLLFGSSVVEIFAI